MTTNPAEAGARLRASFLGVLMVAAFLGVPHAWAQSLVPSALDLLQDPGSTTPGQFAPRGAGTSGEAVGFFRLSGQFQPSSLMVIGRDSVREVPFGDLVDDTGTVLGQLGASVMQMLSDGSIVVGASSGGLSRLLRLVGDQAQRLPITEDGDRHAPLGGTSGYSYLTGSQSRHFWLQRNLGAGFDELDNDLRLIFTDGFTAIDDVVIPQFRRLPPNDDGFSINVSSMVVSAGEAGVLVRELTLTRFRDTNGSLAEPVTVHLFVVGFGQQRSVLNETSTFYANGDREGVGIVTIGSNDRGQVLVQRTDYGARGPRSEFSVSYVRIDSDGTQQTIFDDATATSLGPIRLVGILANGVVVAIAGRSDAPRSALLGIPGESRVLLGPGSEVGDLAVANVISDFFDFPHVAGNFVAIPFTATDGTSPVYVAMARIDDSREFAWTADFGGEWGDAENWDPARIPGQGDETFFDIDSRYEVRVGSRQSGRSRIESGSVSLLEADLELLGPMRVGGGGILTLPGGRLQSGGMVIGHLPPERPGESRDSWVDVDNRGMLEVNDRLTVGAADEGVLRISNSNSSITELVVGSGALGRVSLIGPGPGAEDGINDPFIIIRALKLGDGATAEMYLYLGASVLSGSVVIGGGTESVSLRPATLELRGVTGEGPDSRRTQWEVTPDSLFAIGGRQPGEVTLSDGARLVIVGPLVMGQARIPEASHEGFLTVSGRAGDSGDASLLFAKRLEMSLAEGVNTGVNILEGARVTLGSDKLGGVLRMARASDTESYLSVEGTSNEGPSTLEVIESKDLGLVQINPCIIGEKGVGVVDVLNGGRFHCDGTLLFGSQSGSHGNVRVAGRSGTTPSTLSAAQICIGRAGVCASEEGIQSGRNVLIVEDGGLVEAETLALASGSIIRGNGRIVVNHSLIEGEVSPGSGFVMGPAASMPGEVVRFERMNFTSKGKRVNRHSETSRVLPGKLTFEGDVTFGMSALLLIDIEGSDAEQQDGLVVTGRLEIEEGARLAVHFGNSHVPREGDVLSFITTGEGITGAFSEVRIFGLAPGFEYELDTAGGEVRLTALNDAVVAGSPRFAPLPSLSSEGIRLSIEAPADLETVLLASPDLQLPFAPIHTNQGSFLYVDPIEPGQGQRLYRAIGR